MNWIPIAAILFICLFIVAIQEEYIVLMLIQLAIMLALGIWGAVLVHKSKKEEARKEHEWQIRKTAAEAKKAEEKNNTIASVKGGYYAFPALKFYLECVNAGVKSLDSEYERSKARAIMQAHFQQLGCNSNDYASYMTKLSDYFQKGQTSQLAKDKIPLRGSIKNYHKETEFHIKYAALSKDNKTKTILSNNIKELEKVIKERQEGEAAMKQLAGIISTSYATEKTNNWAFLGGLASGIAGPVAGIAAASSAMADNAGIEARNRANREAVQKTALLMMDSANACSAEKYQLENAKKLLESELASLNLKVIFETPNTEELFKSLSISTIVHNNETSTTVIATIKNKYIPDAPKSAHIAIDGTLQAKILCDDYTIVDTFKLAFPVYGGECGKEIKLIYETPKYMHGEHKNFRAEITPVSLWLAEM